MDDRYERPEGSGKAPMEPEADMEGSGEDSETQVLANFAQELCQSILQTESALVTHLQENQETMRRGQSELRETLEKVSANQDKISQVLLHLTHGGKGPEMYNNRETVNVYAIIIVLFIS